MSEKRDDKSELENQDLSEGFSTHSDQTENHSEPSDNISPSAVDKSKLDSADPPIASPEGELSPDSLINQYLEEIEALPTPQDPDEVDFEPDSLISPSIHSENDGTEEDERDESGVPETILPPEFSSPDVEDERLKTASSDFIDWDWERLKGDSGLAAEEIPVDPADKEETDRFRRLILGEPIEHEDQVESNILSQRHPTGEPDKTGGWYADDIQETEYLEKPPCLH